MGWKNLVGLFAALLLVGCKVEISAPEGGQVVSESRAWECSVNLPCAIDISDTSFDEVFIAEPLLGFRFTGWKRAEGYFCGGSLAPCRLVTTGFVGHDSLMALLDSDRTFYLEPGFLPEDHIRRYTPGNVISLSGTLTVATSGQPEYRSEVNARFEMLASTLTYLNEPVLLWRTLTLDLTSGELLQQERHIWQAADGTLFEVADGWGNTLLDADTASAGLLAIPVPLVPNDYRELSFFIMFGGHTTGPLAQGLRSIEISDPTELEIPGGVATVFQVTHRERIEYLYTWADFDRGDVVETERVLSVAPVKGVVALQETVTELNSQGRVERRSILDLQALKTNF